MMMGKTTTGAMARARRVMLVVGLSLAGLILAAGGFVAAMAAGPRAVTAQSHHHADHHRKHRPSDVVLGNRMLATSATAVVLPVATAPPVAAPAVLVSAPPMAMRENFAFAPYWTLAQSPTFTLTGLSTLAYFAVGVNPDGSLDESGSGWNGYESQDLSNLITRAHTVGERVVLTINDFDQASLNALTSSPSAPARLAAALIPALAAKNLDGVNFDFEGTGSRDQAGLTNLIASVSGALRAADPHWQITMDTYASSAGDPGGFYNIPALAPSVDSFFVMAYELNLAGSPTNTSPLTSGMFSDLTAVQQYLAVVPASKVILGTPFFGIEWPTNNGTMQAQATGPASDIADAQVQSSTEPQYWDPATSTGWTSYLVGQQWHESYLENPYGLFRVAQLSAQYGLRGVGIWALGMEDNGSEMISALDGLAPPGSPGTSGPQSTSSSPKRSTTTTAPATSTTTTTSPSKAPATSTTTTTAAPPASTTTTTVPVITGLFDGSTEHLKAVGPGSIDSGLSLGTLTKFSTDDPAYSCLNGVTLTVYAYGTLSGDYVAVAQKPSDCLNQDFTFPD